MQLAELTISDLEARGFKDAPRAHRILVGLPGNGVDDELIGELLPSLLDALSRHPDPDRALVGFERWSHSVTSRYTQLRQLLAHPAALDILIQVCGTSQYLADILIRNPEYFEILANPGMRGGTRSPADFHRELSRMVDHAQRTEMKLELLRRFRHREVLRIGVRDIVGLAGLRETAREFSHLADACVQKCCEICGAGVLTPDDAGRIAVVAMGKLGGEELNYSSDIDLLFVADNVSDSDLRRLQKFAEAVVSGLSKEMQNGRVFRVDMRLRPEGRFGPLVRTLDSYRAYYESWAETWEIQALIKARPIAGDTRLGRAFVEMVRPFVYRRPPSAKMLADVRANKERLESKAAAEGCEDTDVKIGKGGIRDVEFLVQMLQMAEGGRRPLLRTPNTLDALAKLAHVGVLSRMEAEELSEDYVFLRTVEHRLQILADRQTQRLPQDLAEREHLARRLGYASVQEFDQDYLRRTERVRGHLRRWFAPSQPAPLESRELFRSLLADIETEGGAQRLRLALEGEGFADPERAAATLIGMIVGDRYGGIAPEAREATLDLAGPLIASCAAAGDPDTALHEVAGFVTDSPNTAEALRTLAQSRELLDRLVLLASGSPALVRSLKRNPEWLDMLVSEEVMGPSAKPSEVSLSELRQRLPKRRVTQNAPVPLEELLANIALYVRRERLRIGARDLWGEAGTQVVGLELTGLAEAVLQVLLDQALAHQIQRTSDAEAQAALRSIAIIGLGKLGSRELGYASDWDVLFVYEDASRELRDSPGFRAVNAVVEGILAQAQQLKSLGAEIEMDARLRAEGRFGQLARTVSEYRSYYTESAQTWERQVLTRARPVAGARRTAAAYMRAAHRAIYSRALPEEAADEIRAMKRRIERERLKPDEKERDVKLGLGGLTDIEFLTQMWQMRVGHERPSVRASGTLEALQALGTCGVLPAPLVARLVESHGFFTAIRNRLTLAAGIATDVVPTENRRVRSLAIGMGFADSPKQPAEEEFSLKLREHLRDVRRYVEKWFFGE